MSNASYFYYTQLEGQKTPAAERSKYKENLELAKHFFFVKLLGRPVMPYDQMHRNYSGDEEGERATGVGVSTSPILSDS